VHCEPARDDAIVWRRKLNLKAKSESAPSFLSFKSTDPGSFNTGLIGPICTAPPLASAQGLILVQFSAQRKRSLWDRGFT